MVTFVAVLENNMTTRNMDPYVHVCVYFHADKYFNSTGYDNIKLKQPTKKKNENCQKGVEIFQSVI